MASVEKAGYGHPGAFAEIRRLALIRFDSMYLALHTYMTHTIYHQLLPGGLGDSWGFASRIAQHDRLSLIVIYDSGISLVNLEATFRCPDHRSGYHLALLSFVRPVVNLRERNLAIRSRVDDVQPQGFV